MVQARIVIAKGRRVHIWNSQEKMCYTEESLSYPQIEDIFRVCCILHNMNHDFDGLDNVDVTARMGTLVPERHEREGGDDDDDDDDDGSTEQEQGVRRHERELFRIRRDLLIAHFQYYRGQGVDFYQNT